ncbi:sigma-70 family RNA polymerase sigma factor [Parasphingorhabdus halotolerans]|uniref:Sigma-70 family RNA polymerase sigma factor n=1 Tax=Parasphingorhabdus halotolerans TaxID=2725558 RepID=A0A6H2DQM7_9SPHN|nr:sigma-70 family RNA polymerase sigma factor [Parasphingorhabdus halotolerans]QJB70283.1 sigma-70 family RNA polymerase sigma factor [Parasphingorhabdus halotolerans]
MTEQQSLPSAEFKTELTKTIPHLRAFGRSLSGNPDLADDLVQDTLLKAWSARKRFVAGTSMKAWTFVILRNTYFSNMRRKKFTGNYDELAAERILSAPAPQQDPIHLADLQRGLMELSDDQREAIILVGAGGYSYEEAAEIANCAIGTMKSRVSRARTTLENILETGKFTGPDQSRNSTETALENIIGAVDRIAS